MDGFRDFAIAVGAVVIGIIFLTGAVVVLKFILNALAIV